MAGNFRTGSGYDAHRFCEGRPLILCGVHIPYDRGLAGHSDADAPAQADEAAAPQHIAQKPAVLIIWHSHVQRHDVSPFSRSYAGSAPNPQRCYYNEYSVSVQEATRSPCTLTLLVFVEYFTHFVSSLYVFFPYL